jgi:hypothetical protein
MTKIILDRFPCHLAAAPAGLLEDVSDLRSFEPTPGSSYLEITRVILTETKVIIAKDSANGPQIVFQEDYNEAILADKATDDSRIVTASGKMLAFKKDTGCGCGSKLRGWNPYKTLAAMGD